MTNLQQRAQHLAQLVQSRDTEPLRFFANRAHWPFDVICAHIVGALKSVQRPNGGVTAEMIAETQALDVLRVNNALEHLEAEGYAVCEGGRWKWTGKEWAA